MPSTATTSRAQSGDPGSPSDPGNLSDPGNPSDPGNASDPVKPGAPAGQGTTSAGSPGPWCLGRARRSS